MWHWHYRIVWCTSSSGLTNWVLIRFFFLFCLQNKKKIMEAMCYSDNKICITWTVFVHSRTCKNWSIFWPLGLFSLFARNVVLGPTKDDSGKVMVSLKDKARFYPCSISAQNWWVFSYRPTNWECSNCRWFIHKLIQNAHNAVKPAVVWLLSKCVWLFYAHYFLVWCTTACFHYFNAQWRKGSLHYRITHYLTAPFTLHQKNTKGERINLKIT